MAITIDPSGQVNFFRNEELVADLRTRVDISGKFRYLLAGAENFEVEIGVPTRSAIENYKKILGLTEEPNKLDPN